MVFKAHDVGFLGLCKLDIYIYIYIYIERERESARVSSNELNSARSRFSFTQRTVFFYFLSTDATLPRRQSSYGSDKLRIVERAR